MTRLAGRILALVLAAAVGGGLCYGYLTWMAGPGDAPPSPHTVDEGVTDGEGGRIRLMAPDVATGPARTQPAQSQPALATTRPDPEVARRRLARECDVTARRLRGKLGRGYAVTVSPPFVFAGDMSDDQLDRHARASCIRPAKVMWRSYFQTRPDRPITVLLLSGDKTYRETAKRLLGDEDVSHFGYYRPWDRTMVMNIATGGGTLVHELTHALIAFDFPRVPTWFNEGLASLHEGCRIHADRIEGVVNWRLPGLQRAIGDGTLRPLRDLVTARDFYGKRQGTNYAQARYFIMYVQKLGKLDDLYDAMRDAGGRDGTDVKVIERVLEMKIDEVDRRFVAWVKTLRYRR